VNVASCDLLAPWFDQPCSSHLIRRQRYRQLSEQGFLFLTARRGSAAVFVKVEMACQILPRKRAYAGAGFNALGTRFNRDGPLFGKTTG
jgi:hypothetical protein